MEGILRRGEVLLLEAVLALVLMEVLQCRVDMDIIMIVLVILKLTLILEDIILKHLVGIIITLIQSIKLKTE